MKFLYATIYSAAISWFIIFLFSRSSTLRSLDKHNNLQDFHLNPTPRFGGIAIFASIFLAVFVNGESEFIEPRLFVLSFLILALGLFEDIFSVIKPIYRFIFLAVVVTITVIHFELEITSLEVDAIDFFLKFDTLSILFTVFVVLGAINAVNIIDGFNGLMLGYSLLVFSILFFISSEIGFEPISTNLPIYIGAILGVLFFNYPRGKIFSGDCGSYFLGFLLTYSILYLSIRNHNVSIWIGVLLLIYPLYETLFSIFRKLFIRKKDPMRPDKLHLHMLIYHKYFRMLKLSTVTKNSLTSLPILLICTIFSVPVIFFYNNSKVLVFLSVLFMIFYTTFYFYLLRRRLH